MAIAEKLSKIPKNGGSWTLDKLIYIFTANSTILVFWAPTDLNILLSFSVLFFLFLALIQQHFISRDKHGIKIFDYFITVGGKVRQILLGRWEAILCCIPPL